MACRHRIGCATFLPCSTVRISTHAHLLHFALCPEVLMPADRVGIQMGNSRFPVASGKLPNVGEKPRTPFLLLPLVFLQPTNCLAPCLCQLSSGDPQIIWWGFWRLSGAPAWLTTLRREAPPLILLLQSAGSCAASLPTLTPLVLACQKKRWRHPEG